MFSSPHLLLSQKKPKRQAGIQTKRKTDRRGTYREKEEFYKKKKISEQIQRFNTRER